MTSEVTNEIFSNVLLYANLCVDRVVLYVICSLSSEVVFVHILIHFFYDIIFIGVVVDVSHSNAGERQGKDHQAES